MTHYLVAAALLIAPVPVEARPDPDRAAVMATVDAFFAAINSNDAKALNQLYLPETPIISRRKQADGSWILRTRRSGEDSANAARETRKLTELYWDPRLNIHQGIATFWAPYSFDIDGKRSHCGVDLITLIKTEGTWKISFVSYTVEPDGCPKGR
jgi:hypothetical protein